eukprot:GCRY01001941.1.p1 GENE.GCRY01001941.1~~GCRY01001941.1.p1  ORF type:complete len:279 (-),score=31.44 GCRY01001941.1:649-1485(-)
MPDQTTEILIKAAFSLLKEAKSKAEDICLGLHWTYVILRHSSNSRTCGLCSTLKSKPFELEGPNVTQAGLLLDLDVVDLIQYTRSGRPSERSIGFATMDALFQLSYNQDRADIISVKEGVNAKHLIRKFGHNEHVVAVGHFPFVDAMRSEFQSLSILELNPQPGDFPASESSTVLPQGKVIVMTGMCLVNGTYSSSIEPYLPPQTDDCSRVAMMIGPSTPSCPALLDHGLDILCVSIVPQDSIEKICSGLRQGANISQLNKMGMVSAVIAKAKYWDPL